MLKSICVSILIVFYLIKIVDNQLIIQPVVSFISRDQFKPFIALCTGQNNSRVVTWQSPSQIDIEESSHNRITVERKSSGLRLRIRNLTQNDQGAWKCLGFDQDGKSISETFQINVKIPITFISESIQYAELDSTVIIKCRVLANPSAEISWFKGKDKLEILSSNYQQRDDGLKINRVSLVDNDIFWCQADVIETGESKEYQIQVIIAQPITLTKMTCLTPCAVEKRTATLICEANGIPTPKYSWSYEQNGPFILNEISKYVVRGNRLMINNIDETDNGRYICHAFNDYDKNGQKSEYILNVIIPPVVLPIPPIEISIDEIYPLRSVSFSCHVTRGSIENLSLQWFHINNTPVQPINGISIKSSYQLTELIFDPVRREHHGNYTCLVKNSADTISNVAHLFVQYKPVFIGPEINEIYSVPKHHVVMKCQFDSYPSPVLQWIKIIQEHNQIILENNNPQVIEISTKNIDSTIYETQLIYNPLEEDFGLKFECQANNSRIEKHFIILRRGYPPRQVRITSVMPNATIIQLIVESSLEINDLPLLRYIVKYKQIDDLDSFKIISFPVLSNQSELIELKFLQAATSYFIQIAAESKAGQSIFSIPVQVKTLNGNVPTFSLSNSSCLNSTICLIQWFLQDDGGSSISRTEIFYTKVNRKGKEEKWNKVIHIDAQTTEYLLKELKSNTIYSIRVRLFNAAGHSEQKIRIMTSKLHIDSESRCKPPCSSSIVTSIGIIGGILLIIIVFFVILIILKLWKNKRRNTGEL